MRDEIVLTFAFPTIALAIYFSGSDGLVVGFFRSEPGLADWKDQQARLKDANTSHHILARAQRGNRDAPSKRALRPSSLCRSAIELMLRLK